MINTIIIAEAGVNHNGDLEMAKSLIDVAADSGADLVKFQSFSADRLVCKVAPKANYQLNSTNKNESQYEMLNKLELSYKMHEELIKHCQSRDIEFFSTAFDIESLQMLRELKLQQFKIPSGEITNLPYLRYIGTFKKPIILSTGMTELVEIGNALNILEEAGTPRNLITVLHCNTEYPTPIEDVNLKAMITIREEFGVKVGYSDHTQGIEVPIAAVALGATVIEKHFTLDRSLPGPDQRASVEPSELASMVLSIRKIEKSIGDGLKKPTLSERKNIDIARKSIVAKKNIKLEEIFTDKNITVKRPGTGISPMEWDNIIGKKSKFNFEPDDLIRL